MPTSCGGRTSLGHPWLIGSGCRYMLPTCRRGCVRWPPSSIASLSPRAQRPAHDGAPPPLPRHAKVGASRRSLADCFSGAAALPTTGGNAIIVLTKAGVSTASVPGLRRQACTRWVLAARATAHRLPATAHVPGCPPCCLRPRRSSNPGYQIVVIHRYARNCHDANHGALESQGLCAINTKGPVSSSLLPTRQ